MQTKNIIYLIGVIQLVVVDPLMWYFTQVKPYAYERYWAITLVINLFLFAAIIFMIMQRTIKERV
ncbi:MULTISPECIES: hypothetical protein [Acidiplasma]|jgi:hypothetical protein|uniref:Uncharacterized protein n=2 Tax=Acidiplasma TaxID=507753 RepID=A0A0Q0WJF6_9ARCH|nr:MULTISPECIES: hypothetical protein [Acidiplasma]KJE49930.1 hypothetical protein TZ01_02335 [Acidiplasma sp. MBA-1]KPV47566.1 hypothetical protein SE19_00495 [Acidiplasma aeolicum]KQB35561.1 hypothetical protein AOG54_00340 [Acidiplasma aeolicum]KQB35778.1 hypothetical protein AOG55_05830 [Acidiplasma cupricumulans]WMT55118.1 MAG: hypothetical protein RE470_00375 [Acidiplasma sp.]